MSATGHYRHNKQAAWWAGSVGIILYLLSML